MQLAKLRLVLVLVLLAVQLGTMTLLWLDTRNEATSQISQTARSALGTLAGAVTDQATHVLDPARNTAQIAAELIRSGLLDAGNDEKLARFFLTQVRANETINGAYLGRDDGSLVSFTRKDDGLRLKIIRTQPTHTVRLADYDGLGLRIREWTDPSDRFIPGEQHWFAEAKSTTLPVWTQVFQSGQSMQPEITTAVTVQTPLGEPAGVVGIDTSLASLSDFIARTQQMPKTAAVILDKDRQVVAASDWKSLQESRTTSTYLPQLHQLNNPAMDDLYDRHYLYGSDLARTHIDGQTYLGVRQPLKLFNGQLEWLLMVQSPTTGITAGLSA